MLWPPTVLGEVTDPNAIARSRAQDARGRRNSDWLQAHWNELLPQAYGKHLAVAGQQAFLADTAEQAIALAKAAHPDDDGVFVEYVMPPGGPRWYGDHGVIHFGSGWDNTAVLGTKRSEGQRSVPESTLSR